MFRDNEFPMSSGSFSISPSEPAVHNDDFDDVFGSEPGSPTFDVRDGHDGDMFGGGNTEISDIPRLKEKHETEGYRDGVTKGKAESVQKGFDEGYGLGAVLGLRIGKVIGILEGIFGAVSVSAGKSEDTQWTSEKSRLEELFKNAKEELKTEKVFAREWWGEDGIWKFEVPGEKEGKDVVFPDVAAAHPLLKKWEGLLEEEIKRWSLDLEFMEGNEEDAVPAKQQIKADAVEQKMGTVKTDLNW
ncbi:f3c2aa3c-62bc-4fce-8aa3-251fee2e708c-CDS [Sclerotinia trifoliorum]|uniref:Protein YAE1 n=1 Tax=Sclerotinia trifoliorum TaxID=28548 RepID=A0A8H2ZPW2_9HELO|nr:f3c2aa3c-62bc-4fce-8aa3-251fee2e708c-CDS [Sclerotinia trifoliorum]